MILIRICDIVLAMVLILVFGLPMLAIALAVRFSDKGPAIFAQTRVGMRGRHFEIYKFRTMRHAPLAAKDRGAVSTSDGDPRITAIGSKLRPSHLDELPQILNVLKGDMSFVGVRPDTPLQEADYPDGYWQKRHAVRPGLTGPAQLLRGEVNLERRMNAELSWLDSAGIAEYFAVLFKTAGKVVSRSSH